MRTYCYIIATLLLFGACSQETEEPLLPAEKPGETGESGEQGEIPADYFVATFSIGDTRGPVTGPDDRVSHIRYLVYKSTGEFVKERVLIAANAPTPVWPLAAVRDTLPKGDYQVVFLANVEKTLFPYQLQSGETGTSEVLSNYQGTYDQARILLPPTEFGPTTEYYWAKADFSDIAPNPSVLLQRIIGMLNVHRNNVDAQEALDALVANIVEQLNYKDLIRTTVEGLLPGLVEDAVGGLAGMLLDPILNALLGSIIDPIVNFLYDLLLQELVHQIGAVLSGNEDQAGLLGVLGALLNPWQASDVQAAVVSMTDFPTAIDLNLNVTDIAAGSHPYLYRFNDDTFWSQKCFYIRGFEDTYQIDKINVVREGLVGGLVIDGILESPFLLQGTFIDIPQPLSHPVAYNYRYKADYSFLDLGLKDYTQQTDGESGLTLSVQLLQIDGLRTLIEDALGGILGIGLLLGSLLDPILNITVSVPINLPLLGIDNLSLSGGWDTPTPY